MRVQLKGLKKVKAKLADGTFAIYYYAWKGGPRLSGKPGDPAFIAAYNDAVGAKAKPKSTKTLATILDAFQDSEAFRGLAARTAKDYRKHLASIAKKFGDFPIGALTDARSKGVFLTWRDELARKSPRGADYVFAVFARALSWGVEFGNADANPLEKPGRVWRGNRKDSTWGDVEEVNMRAACGPALRLALTLALWTAQRQGDILKLTWAAYDGELLRVRQGKTRVQLSIPVSAALKAELDATKRAGLYIVSHDGVPYTSDGFRSSWAKAAARAGISDLTFHDLRGTFATRAYECGATDAEVAAVTGHGVDDTDNAILRRHYLSLNLALARECIRKLETRTRLENEKQNDPKNDLKPAEKNAGRDI